MKMNFKSPRYALAVGKSDTNLNPNLPPMPNWVTRPDAPVDPIYLNKAVDTELTISSNRLITTKLVVRSRFSFVIVIVAIVLAFRSTVMLS